MVPQLNSLRSLSSINFRGRQGSAFRVEKVVSIIRVICEICGMKAPRSRADRVWAIEIMSIIYRSPAGRDFRFAKTSCGALDPKRIVCACPVK